MNELFLSLAEFIITPLFRWICLAITIVLNIIKYTNEPQRFSFKTAFTGLTFKWHLFLIIAIALTSNCLTTIGMWGTIPFTKYLPDYWYVYVYIIALAIVTQITINSKQVEDDGSFNPPPTYLLPDKYRILISYVSLIINIFTTLQSYIYFGIADYSKKSILSRYITERYGGWYEGNKMDFIFNWTGVFDIVESIYILYLQYNFQACNYGLPSSWNF
jgi:hypothetical protein